MKNKAAQALGSIRTEKKAAAARENGAKGGRPATVRGGILKLMWDGADYIEKTNLRAAGSRRPVGYQQSRDKQGYLTGAWMTIAIHGIPEGVAVSDVVRKFAGSGATPTQGGYHFVWATLGNGFSDGMSESQAKMSLYEMTPEGRARTAATLKRHAEMRTEAGSEESLRSRLANLERQFAGMSAGPAKKAVQGEIARIKSRLA